MTIDLSDILGRISYETEVKVPFETDIIIYGGEYSVVEKSEVTLKLKNMGAGKAQISGAVDITVLMQCGRCLKPVYIKLELKPFVNIDPDNEEEPLEDLAYVSGYSFDVDGFVLDECYVQLPMNVLCSESCKGLCIKCGKDLNEGLCGCDTFIPDPRMAKILDIYNASKEEV